MKKLAPLIHDTENGLDYILVGEIYLPLIAVLEETRDIGFYGSLRRNYLRDYKSGLYSYLSLSGKLWTHLADVNEQCIQRRDLLMEQIMKQEEVITKYCDQIFNSGAETEEFFYRLGLKDGMKMKKIIKGIMRKLSR